MRGLKFICAIAGMFMLSGMASAQEAVFDLPMASTPYIQDHEAFKLALNEAQPTSVKKSESAAPEIKKSEFEPSLFTGTNVHKYLGLGTIVGAALTAVTAPGEGCETNCAANTPRERNGTHAKLARATVAMATAAVITGVLAHWDDLSFEDGFDRDKIHAILGVTGALVMAKAVNKSAGVATGTASHAAQAELGALLMVTAIKINW
jgi:hypothetical protein